MQTEAVKKTEVLMRILTPAVSIAWSDRNTSGGRWVDQHKPVVCFGMLINKKGNAD